MSNAKRKSKKVVEQELLEEINIALNTETIDTTIPTSNAFTSQVSNPFGSIGTTSTVYNTNNTILGSNSIYVGPGVNSSPYTINYSNPQYKETIFVFNTSVEFESSYYTYDYTELYQIIAMSEIYGTKYWNSISRQPGFIKKYGQTNIDKITRVIKIQEFLD